MKAVRVLPHSSALLRVQEPPEAYADRIAEQARVLCLDEVELDDPAGAVRLIAVLKALRERGVTLAATSNAEPENFVSARQGRERLERFISEEFAETSKRPAASSSSAPSNAR